MAVVTGAARGIGLATTRLLAEAGAHVVLADVDASALEKATQALRNDGLDVSSRALDVRSSHSVDALVEDVGTAHARLDIWINNAGIYPADPALALTDEAWREVLSTNLDGVFRGCRAAGRAMTDTGGGVIVNIGSVSGFRVAGDGRAHYAASKAGLRGLTMSFARELGPSGVRVLLVVPSMVITEGTAAREDNTGDDSAARYAAMLPLRRAGSPLDIARVVLFCVSDLAGFMTGSAVVVDGGHLAI